MSEKTSITIEEARALISDTVLWPRVRDFLWDFASQIHSSWIAGLGQGPSGEGREDESGSSRVSRLMSSSRVKRLVLMELGVEPCFHSFPKDDWSRLLLLDGATIESIVKWIGALALADDLRLVTDGKTVRELKAALSGVYPEVFGYTAYFAGLDLQGRDAKARSSGDSSADGWQSTAADVVSYGLAFVNSVLAPLPECIVSRFKFKLPKGLCASAPLRFKPEACGKVVSRLLKLKFPEAYSLCC